MSRTRPVTGLATAGLLLVLASACGEDGKTAPERCAEPPLPIFDIQGAGAPNVDNPCVTAPGFAISGTISESGGTSSSGGTGGSSGTAGTGTGG